MLQLEQSGRRKADGELIQDGTEYSKQEGPNQVRRVDAAVARLQELGYVDGKRVALIGFSRSGYLTYYVATHPGTTPIGAAVVFDSITAGYAEYVYLAGLCVVDLTRFRRPSCPDPTRWCRVASQQ